MGSPKFEGRKPKPEHPAGSSLVRISDFGLLSGFGSRPSDFKPNYAHRLLSMLHSTVVAFAGLGALAGCGHSATEVPQKATPPVTVQTVAPRRGEITRTITLPSFRILAYQEATLYRSEEHTSELQ